MWGRSSSLRGVDELLLAQEPFWRTIPKVESHRGVFMIRVVLIAYLSLATVLGPALCCCNAQQLFSMGNGSTCCTRAVLRHSDAENTQNASHHHHHANAQHHHEHSTAKDTSKSDQRTAPRKHGGSSCPCGKHYASLVAALTDGPPSNAGEVQNQKWSVLVAALPAMPAVAVLETFVLAHRGPAKLYGREILRAYQILRC